jgi:hypothetical protein
MKLARAALRKRLAFGVVRRAFEGGGFRVVLDMTGTLWFF